MLIYKEKVKVCGSKVYWYKYRHFIAYDYQTEVKNSGLRPHHNGEKEDTAYYRKRRYLRDVIMTNATLSKTPDIKFLTLTFADNVTSLKLANYEFMTFIQRFKRKYGYNPKYVAVPEYQKRGSVHYHLVLFDVPYVKNAEISEIWGNGHTWIMKAFTDSTHLANYVSKYLSKDSKMEKNKKSYFMSRNIKRPVEHKIIPIVQRITSELIDIQPIAEIEKHSDKTDNAYKRREYDLMEYPDKLARVWAFDPKMGKSPEPFDEQYQLQ